jgi:hypothetical protein
MFVFHRDAASRASSLIASINPINQSEISPARIVFLLAGLLMCQGHGIGTGGGFGFVLRG